MKKKLVLMTSALMAVSLLAGCGQKAHTHEYKLVDEVAATCTESGVHAHYTCEGCDKLFDEGKKETTLEALTIPAHHTLTHHGAKAATRLEDGNIEYWTCDVCGKYFSDEEGKNEIDAQSIITPALGTNKSYFDGTYWFYRSEGYHYQLQFYGNKEFDDYIIYYHYYFNDFTYDDETKELSFTVTSIRNSGDVSSAYKVGDKISFTYNAEKDVLMFGTIELSKIES